MSDSERRNEADELRETLNNRIEVEYNFESPFSDNSIEYIAELETKVDELTDRLKKRLDYIAELLEYIDKLEATVDELRETSNNRIEYIDKLETKLDKLTDQLNNRLEYINELETKCRDLSEELNEANLAVENNRKAADEEALKQRLSYRDGMIAGLKYAMTSDGFRNGDIILVHPDATGVSGGG